MVEHWLVMATFVAAIGAGLIAGVFYAFSTFVMKALSRRPATEGMAAMQAINATVINPLFLGLFLGTAVACAAVAVGAMPRWQNTPALYLLAGAALYLIGTFGVTMAFNVPLNKELSMVTSTDPDAAGHWTRYVSRWTNWNHVRTAAATAAAASLTLALFRWP